MKILYIDIPFKTQPYSARQKRSELLLNYCKKNNELDLVLFCNNDDYYESTDALYPEKVESIKLDNLSYNDKYYRLGDGQIKKMATLLNQNKYELVFVRESNFLPLIELIDFYLPDAKIIIDQTLIPKMSQTNFARKFFTNDNLKNYLGLKNIFFTFPSLNSLMLFKNNTDESAADLERKMFVLLNPLSAAPHNQEKYNGPNYVLMYGDYRRQKNIQALEYFLKNQYQLISKNLKDTNTYLYLMGNNINAIWEKAKINIEDFDRINPIGPVKNVEKYLVHSKCLIIPDETKGKNLTRLFESLSLSRPVIINPEYTDVNSELIIKSKAPQLLHETLNEYIEKFNKESFVSKHSQTNEQTFNQFFNEITSDKIKNVA